MVPKSSSHDSRRQGVSGQQLSRAEDASSVSAAPTLQHVLLLVHRYPPALGGAEAYAARLAAHLQQHSCAVRVWTTTAHALEELWRPQPSHRSHIREQRPEAVVERFPPCPALPARRWWLKAISVLCPHPLGRCLAAPCNPICPGMWRRIRRFDEPLDAVHALAFPYAFLAACGLRLARRRQVPFFLTPFLHFGDIDDPYDPTRRAYTASHLRWLLRQADGVFVQTAAEREVVLSCGVEPQRVFLQGLGVDPTDCTGGDRVSTRRAWGVDEQTIVIGHLANLSREKGTVDLLEAIARLHARGLPCRLVLAGPDMPNFRRVWSRRDWPAVCYLGPLTPQQKRDFFAAIDIFALPSRTDSFGLVLLEAWANGKPVVAWRAGGPGELIRHEQDGLLAPCGHLDELTEQLARLVLSPMQRQTLGEHGLQRIDTEFRWQDKLEVVRQRMTEVIQRRHAQAAKAYLP